VRNLGEVTGSEADVLDDVPELLCISHPRQASVVERLLYGHFQEVAVTERDVLKDVPELLCAGEVGDTDVAEGFPDGDLCEVAGPEADVLASVGLPARKKQSKSRERLIGACHLASHRRIRCVGTRGTESSITLVEWVEPRPSQPTRGPLHRPGTRRHVGHGRQPGRRQARMGDGATSPSRR